MLLAMVEDIRVVLLRLASRVQTLRFLADRPAAERMRLARETLDIYAPLANRLGVWQLKWELEDLSFRFSSRKPTSASPACSTSAASSARASSSRDAMAACSANWRRPASRPR
jgi:hypothetical protein